MKKLIFTILLAAVLWTVMFSPWTAPFVNFWWMMTGSALTLSVFATLFNPGWWREVKWSLPNVLLGLGIAVALWGVFWLGDKVSSWMFDFARPQVDSIYGMKEGESPWLLLSEPLCRYYLVSCSVGCGGIYIFPDMIIVYKNKVAVMGRIKTRQIDALNYKKASI